MFKKKIELDKINVPFFSDNFFNTVTPYYNQKFKILINEEEKTRGNYSNIHMSLVFLL